jgi:hypothetical protein
MLHMIKPHAIEFGDVVIVQAIKDLSSILATAHKPHVTQPAQLMGDSRFSDFKPGRDVTHVHFTFKQNGDDPQTGGVAEGTEQVSQMGGGRSLE